jgi:hypothetical protein
VKSPCFLIVPVGACAVFMLEYGRNLLFGFFSTSLSGVFSFPLRLSELPRFPNSSYAWKGFLNTALFLEVDMLFLGECCEIDGLRLFGAGWNDSSRTLTKLEGNRPTARGSLRSRPIHHCPSPAFSASIRSPSMKPKSFFVSPPQEYVALHQQGNIGRSSGIAMLLAGTRVPFSRVNGRSMACPAYVVCRCCVCLGGCYGAVMNG